ncbi:MAG: DUF2336 domain-containing protein [Parvularculaceae bacterium]|nr:DUF2336 domain-containing protein [Parvularculaceae bacterium]
MATLDPAATAPPAGGGAAVPAATVVDGLTPPVARQSTPRELMVRKLIDIVVLPAARISAHERALTGDVLLQVVDKVEEPLRVEIARRLARVAEAPPALVRLLLLDEPSVAKPIIQHSDHLPEALLIECARQGSTAHRELIARRINLTTSIADALVEFNEPEVARLLLRREEFTLSPHAIDILVSRSTHDKEIQALLLRRKEIEPAHGFMMFWWVDAQRRRRILTRFALDRGIIQDALQDLYPRVFRQPNGDPFVKELLAMLDRRHRPRGVNGEAVSMDVVRKTLQASLQYPSQEVIHAVGMVAGVSRELAARVMRDPGGEPFAVMCKSLGISRDDFFSLVRNYGEWREPKQAEGLLAVFDMMARDFSRAVLRYWDWDGNPRIAAITRLLGIE